MIDRAADMIIPFRGVKVFLRTDEGFRARPIFEVEAENALPLFVYNFAFACPGRGNRRVSGLICGFFPDSAISFLGGEARKVGVIAVL
jgi:hypothetical protein